MKMQQKEINKNETFLFKIIVFFGPKTQDSTNTAYFGACIALPDCIPRHRHTLSQVQQCCTHANWIRHATIKHKSRLKANGGKGVTAVAIFSLCISVCECECVWVWVHASVCVPVHFKVKCALIMHTYFTRPLETVLLWAFRVKWNWNFESPEKLYKNYTCSPITT